MTPLGNNCSATIRCAGVLMSLRGATGGPAERFGHPGGPSRRRGWTEEERICRCATTKGRAPQRTDRAAWGPKIRLASPVSTQYLLERGQQAFVLLARADGDAEPARDRLPM